MQTAYLSYRERKDFGLWGAGILSKGDEKYYVGKRYDMKSSRLPTIPRYYFIGDFVRKYAH